MKKLNVFMLALLIIGQTILGPIGVASASADGQVQTLGESQTPDESQTTGDNQAIGDDQTPSDSQATDDDQTIGDSQATGDDQTIGDSQATGDDQTIGDSQATGDDQTIGEEVLGRQASPFGMMPFAGEEEILAFAETYDDMDLSNIETVTFSPQPDENGKLNVKNGDTASFRFDLINLPGSHQYGPGSTLTIPLPNVFKNFQARATTNVGDIKFAGQNVIFTFNESVLGPGDVGAATEDIFFEFSATIDNGAGGLEETITIPGGGTIELNFTPANGTPITKKTNNQFQTNADSIEWEVIVNTNLVGASGMVDFVDTLETGHKFKQEDVTITALTMKADGTYDEGTPGTTSPTLSDSNTKMTLKLAGDKAYKITYKTYPEDPGNGGRINYKNSATYDGSSPKNATAQVEYDTGIKKERKSQPSGNDLTTDWEITVNENKRNLGTITVTDKWTTTGGSAGAKQELVDGVKVYEADGTTEVTSGFSFNQAGITDAQGFNIVFTNIGTDTYVIKYTTKPTADTYINNNMTVSNTVTRSDDTDEFKDNKSVTYNKTSFMLNKTAAEPNYATKKIDWSIVANQAKEELSNPVFEDRYTNPNMTLDESTLVVKVGNTILGTTDYTLDKYTNVDGKQTGFDIKLSGTVNEQVTITYTTDYEIQNIGSNTNVYRNDVTLKSDNAIPDTSDWAQRTSEQKEEQKDNGKKTGHYNYNTKRFEWEVELNFNLNSLSNAVFEDTISNAPGQTIDLSTVKVFEGTLTSNGDFVQGANITDDDKITVNGNTLKVELGQISTPHKITYESYVTDDVIPETAGKLQVTNTATLKDGTTLNANWSKTVGVNYTDKLINKTGAQLKDSQGRNTAGIKWSFEFNYAQSNLKDIVITDDVGKDADDNPNQLYKEDSFKVYPVTLSGTSASDSFSAATVGATPLDPSEYTLNVNVKNGTFELKLKDGTDAYYVEYETVYLGANGQEVKNQVAVQYESADGTSAQGAYSFANFQYNGGGNVIRVPFVVVKTDGATGEPMEDIEFTLYHKASNRALMSDTTDENGVLDFGINFSESDYYLKEENLPVDYQDPGNIEFTLHRDNVEPSGLYKDHQVVEVENFPVGYDASACPNFTLTAKDIDGNPVTNITLINKTTGKEYPSTSGIDGKFTFDRANLPAGKYSVKTEENGKEITLSEEITVQYDDCEEELVQPTPSCEVFTITVKDANDNIRPGVEVELRTKAGDVVDTFTTDSNGSFTVDSTLKDPNTPAPPGKYYVYEGKQLLGEVDITYTDNCEAEVTEVPSCPTFTLTVKDADGKNAVGQEVTIKDEKDNVVVAATTTDANGQITTTNLEQGKYTVYDKDNNQIGESFTLNLECEAEVQIAPACSVFTITILDETKNVRPNVAVTLKQGGNDVIALPTDQDGKIEVPSEDLPAGEYDVYEGGIFLGKVTVTHINNCEAELDPMVPGAGTCPIFELTVNDRSNNGRDGVEVNVKDAGKNVIATGTTGTDGKITFPNIIKPGTYEVYEVENGTEKLINSFTVTTDCFAEVKPRSSGGGWVPPTPACEEFIITVKQNGVKVGADVELTLKSGATEVAKGKTNASGEIVFDKADLPEGTYTAYDKDGKDVGTITVTHEENECQAEIDLLVKACEEFTITVKESGKVVDAGTSITLKDASGNTVATGTTDSNGKIVFAEKDLAKGSYTAYDKDGKEVGKVVVSYDEGKCQDEIDLVVKSCDTFTLTVKESGKVKPNTSITLKDASGKTVTTGTTDKDGKIVFTKEDIVKGSYTAYDKDGKQVGTVVVSYDEGKCQDEINIIVQSCEAFTITVKESGKVKPGTSLTLKDASGKTVQTGTTDKDGKVVFAKDDLASGSYTVYDNAGNKIGTVTVSYDEGQCQAVVDLKAPACENFELTVRDTPNTNIEIKDKDGNTVVTGTTDGNGKVTFNQSILEGDYDVRINGQKVAELSVTDSCEGVVTPDYDRWVLDDGDDKPGTPGGDGSDKPTKPGDEAGEKGDGGTKPGSKLPQTGEESFLLMLSLGFILLATGGFILFRQRREIRES